MIAALFVDSTNLFYQIRNKYQDRLNYQTYIDSINYELPQTIPLHRKFAYGTYNPGVEQFVSNLIYLGFETRFSPVVRQKDEHKFYDWSVGMSMEIVAMVDGGVNTVYVGSNNINLIPLYKYLHYRGVKVILYACNIPEVMKDIVSVSYEIQPFCLLNYKQETNIHDASAMDEQQLDEIEKVTNE